MISGNGFLERLVAGKWIAGPSIRDSIRRSKELNALKITAIINYLGEEFTSEEDIEDTVITYQKLILEIHKHKVNADISVKASQLGLRVSSKKFVSNYSKIVSLARKNKVFVWLDMETAADVDATVSAYKSQLKAGGHVGICIQSYLKRSASDIKSLSRLGAVIRLVKGAYSSDTRTAFRSRQEKTANYKMLMEYMFLHSNDFVIATHDQSMVSLAKRLHSSHHKNFQYAMLNGIRGNLAKQLAGDGWRVEVYVPFGTRWLSYSYRRLKEASNLSLVLKSIFSS